MYPTFKAAACHVAPVFLDKAATLEKALDLIQEGAKNGASLIVFPEVFISAYPVWAGLWAPLYTGDLFKRLVEESIQIDGAEMRALRHAARKAGVFVSIGINEKSPLSAGCLWNANVLISDEGEILVHHRKLVPTSYERLIWASGDGEGLRVADTRLGKLGMLICGENTNPLARFSMMAQGEQVHISTWPGGGIHPTRVPSSGANYDLTEAVRIRAQSYSFEAKVFGIVCSGVTDRKAYDFLVGRDPAVAEILDGTPRSISMFVAPTGEQMGEILQHDEGILYGDIDLGQLVAPKQVQDILGFYNRFDIFDLAVTRKRLEPIRFIDTSGRPAYPSLEDDEPPAMPAQT